MGKSFKLESLPSITLPRFVQEAFSTIPEGFSYVSHTSHSLVKQTRKKSIRGKKEKITITEIVPNDTKIKESGQPYLTGSNYALFLGKIFPEKCNFVSAFVPDRFSNKAIPEEKMPEHIYNKDFISAALEHLGAHLIDGEKARIVIGHCLSELINGKKDVIDALSAQDEAALIRRVAKAKFPKLDKWLDIKFLDQLPLHRELFSALQAKQNPITGKSDVNSLLCKDYGPLQNNCNSLNIAACLYRAATRSEELANMLEATVPRRLKTANQNRKISWSWNYAIIEIAVRIAEILDDRNIHAGVERQAVYDKIIVEILKGSKGRFADVKALEELLQICEGHAFNTLHIDNKNNPSVFRSIRSRARMRLAAIGLMGASMVVAYGGVTKLRNDRQEELRQAKINDAFLAKLRLVNFTHENDEKLGDDDRLGIFNKITDHVLRIIGIRYGVAELKLETIRPYMVDFLIKNPAVLPSLQEGDMPCAHIGEKFVKKNKHYLEVLGIDASNPNKNYLQTLCEWNKKHAALLSCHDKQTKWKEAGQPLSNEDLEILAQTIPTNSLMPPSSLVYTVKANHLCGHLYFEPVLPTFADIAGKISDTVLGS